VTEHAPVITTGTLLNPLLSIFSPERVLSFSDYEVAVYFTPRGQVCEWREANVYQAKVCQPCRYCCLPMLAEVTCEYIS